MEKCCDNQSGYRLVPYSTSRPQPDTHDLVVRQRCRGQVPVDFQKCESCQQSGAFIPVHERMPGDDPVSVSRSLVIHRRIQIMSKKTSLYGIDQVFDDFRLYDKPCRTGTGPASGDSRFNSMISGIERNLSPPVCPMLLDIDRSMKALCSQSGRRSYVDLVRH